MAVTVVVPPASGSNSMPPVATPVGEYENPPAMTTVRLWAPPASVTSWATPDAELVMVTVSDVPARGV